MKDLILLLGTPTLASIITYLIARRKASGSITTSEATDIWKEGMNIRKELREEVRYLRNIINDLTDKLDKLREEKVIDRAKIIELVDKIKGLEIRLRDLETRL